MSGPGDSEPRTAGAAEATRPPVRVARVGVEVIGDLAHHRVDVVAVGSEASGRHLVESGEHVLAIAGRRLGACEDPSFQGRLSA